MEVAVPNEMRAITDNHAQPMRERTKIIHILKGLTLYNLGKRPITIDISITISITMKTILWCFKISWYLLSMHMMHNYYKKLQIIVHFFKNI